MIPSLRRTAPASLALVLALGLSACAGNSADTGSDAAAAPSASTSMAPGMEMGTPGMQMGAQPAGLDAQFLTAMVPHHQSASDMATIALERAKDPAVKALAQRIVDAQSAEITQMNTLAQTKFDVTPMKEMGAMTHEMMGMTMSMDMGADIEMLRTSPTPDKTFLELMIPHHASALTMADEEVRDGKDPEVKALAQKIKDDQAKEIGEMQELLTRLA